MTDHLTAEDAARLLEGTTPGPWGIHPASFMVSKADAALISAAPALAAALADSVPRAKHDAVLDDLISAYLCKKRDAALAERDAALAEVERLRSALTDCQRATT